MLTRLWRLLETRDRRRVLYILPVLMLTGGIEVIGVAAVIPFLTLLADPPALYALPIVGPWIEARGGGDPRDLLRWSGVLLAFLLLLANALVIWANWWVYHFSGSLVHRLSSRLLRHYLSQPYAFMLSRNTAALANKLMVEIRNLVENGYRSWLEILSRGIVIAALVGFLIVLDPLMAAVVFGGLGGAYATVFLLSRTYLRRIGLESVALGAARLKAVDEALGGFKDLRVMGREAPAFERYDRPARRHGAVLAKQHSIAILPRYALEAIAVGGMVVVAATLAGRAGTIASTLPVLGAYAFAGLRLMPLMQQLFAAVARSRYAEGSLEAVEADFEQSDSGEGALEGVPDPLAFERSIRLDGVTFSYPDTDQPALREITLEIPRRSSVALVGRTGSGKTTLVDLILGLHVPDAGTIEVDGKAVTVGTRRAYRRLFGYVPQNVFLFDDTVRRNVTLGLDDAAVDMEALRHACSLAQIDSFIERELPRGYETEVGERGVRLSGGQMQRIGIARALYHRPPVLVLDEATSALDIHTERYLYAALEAISRDHTVITVAHRLETAVKADVVVVLDHGRVIDQGPPDEVLARYRATSIRADDGAALAPLAVAHAER